MAEVGVVNTFMIYDVRIVYITMLSNISNPDRVLNPQKLVKWMEICRSFGEPED